MKRTMKERFDNANMPTKIVMGGAAGLGGIGLFIFFCFLFGFFIQFLWKVTLVELFDFPTISYWQAIGLFILAKLFFGFGGGGNNQQGKKKSKKNMNDFCKEAMTDLDGKPFDKTVPEEDEDFPKEPDFKQFWQDQGKDAYEAYLAARNKASNESSEDQQ